MANETKNIITLPKIIGLPPDTHVSDRLMYNSMPVMNIYPSEPNTKLNGLTVFKLKKCFKKYHDILKKNKFQIETSNSVENGHLKLAFIADNFPTDSFSNEYGESFLNKITDVVSQGAGEVSQMLGGSNAIESTKKLADVLKAQKGIFETIGSGLEKGASGTENLIASLKEGGKGSQFLGGAATMLSRMAAGARVDFPQVWKNSGFTPSYSATIRLYNPNPGNEQSTLKYIIGPIAAILCLALPRAGEKGETSNTYNWPFFHEITCPGIFKLNPGFISNVSIIKGGDQQQIAWNQTLSMVDVRIDMGSLYNSMLLEVGANANDRPTLRTYLDNLKNGNRVVYNTKTEPFEITTEEYNRLFPTETVKTKSTSTESDPETIQPRTSTEKSAISNELATRPGYQL